MKKILLVLLFLPLITLSQVKDSIPSKSNFILVKGVTFSEACSKLMDAGYVIQSKDNDLQTAKTEPKVYPKHWNAAYVIYIRIKDSTAYINATFTAPWNQALFGPSRDPLWKDDPAYHHTNRKGKTHEKSMIGLPFLWANDFAKTFGKPLEYIIKN